MKRENENAIAFSFCKQEVIETLAAAKGKPEMLLNEVFGLSEKEYVDYAKRFHARIKEILESVSHSGSYRNILEVSDTLTEFVLGCIIYNNMKADMDLPPELMMLKMISETFKKLAEE